MYEPLRHARYSHYADVTFARTDASMLISKTRDALRRTHVTISRKEEGYVAMASEFQIFHLLSFKKFA